MTITINGTTGIAGVDGSASTPAFQGNDPDTGIFYPAGNTVAAASGGATVWNASSTFGFKNRIINGAMVIDQRRSGASFSNLVSNEYTLDRWSCYGNVAGRFSIQRSSSSVIGFTNSLLVTSLAATTPGSTDIYILRQYIEGFNTADLYWGTASAQPITVSFWVQSSLTGTFGGVIKNGVENRGYPFTYTINAANTNEYKTITIPGDTTGAWATDTNCGIQLLFSLGAGSGAVTSPGVWSSGNIWAPTGQSNIVGTNGATWRITGVQLEAGTVATSWDFRSIQTELQLCYRYYQNIGSNFYGTVEGTSTYCFQVPYLVPTRVSATVSGRSGGVFSVRYLGDTNITNPTLANITSGTHGVWLQVVSSGLVNGTTIYGRSQFTETNNFLAVNADF